jgi:hypothetical protein
MAAKKVGRRSRVARVLRCPVIAIVSSREMFCVQACTGESYGLVFR